MTFTIFVFFFNLVFLGPTYTPSFADLCMQAMTSCFLFVSVFSSVLTE